MNAITAISAAVLMMSSRQIAEETGKEHFHVMRDLRALKDQLGPMFKGSIQNWIHPQNGQSYEEFLIDKDTCLTLLLGYDAVARMKVVKRWQELEAQAAPAVPRTMSQALRLAAEQAEQIEQQQAALALAAPKAEYVDRYVAANGAKGFRQVAKLLGANEHAFRAWLQDEKIMYRLGGEWTAHQCHIDAGRFVVKTGVAQANEHAFNTTKFTPLGVNWVAGLWGQHQARLAQEGAQQ
ncbi:phage antirepressor KilAC domain-containing protein [Delftia sp. ZNC0008]|uniref:phage antirepressor KilAC domain-containing protein n=1 Tax=Delftia sp. ZNC0008 TaxID=1339242 RepID=UPI00064689F6|nr:phage antirepressor KilAC domain-containing protein [Delftia sp. ZNC0008]